MFIPGETRNEMPSVSDTPVTPEMEDMARQALSDLYAGKEPEISSDIETILLKLLKSDQTSSDIESLLLTRKGQRLFRRFANNFPNDAKEQIKSIIRDDGSVTCTPNAFEVLYGLFSSEDLLKIYINEGNNPYIRDETLYEYFNKNTGLAKIPPELHTILTEKSGDQFLQVANKIRENKGLKVELFQTYMEKILSQINPGEKRISIITEGLNIFHTPLKSLLQVTNEDLEQPKSGITQLTIELVTKYRVGRNDMIKYIDSTSLNPENKKVLFESYQKDYASNIIRNATTQGGNMQSWTDTRGGNDDPSQTYLDPYLAKIDLGMIRKGSTQAFGNEQEVKRFALIVARNLYFSGVDINKVDNGTLSKAIREIDATRDTYDNVNIFKGRNIVFAAHGESLPKEQQGAQGKDRFGKASLLNKIREQGGRIDLNRPADQVSFEELGKLKQSILAKIEQTPPPFTFVFAGHGGPDAIYFAEGVPGLDGKLSDAGKNGRIEVSELAQAYQKRLKKFASYYQDSLIPGKQDILIFSACFSGNFVTKFLADLPKDKKPIISGSSEYGQYGYSDYNNFYGGNYWTKVLKIQEGKKAPATLGNIMNAGTQQLRGGADFTPYLVVPTGKAEKYLQVAEADKELQGLNYA